MWQIILFISLLHDFILTYSCTHFKLTLFGLTLNVLETDVWKTRTETRIVTEIKTEIEAVRTEMAIAGIAARGPGMWCIDIHNSQQFKNIYINLEYLLSTVFLFLTINDHCCLWLVFVYIQSLTFCRSLSPKSRDGKIKREKNVKAEEEEEEAKKKEKVKTIASSFWLPSIVSSIVWGFKSPFRSNLYLWKSFLPRRRQQRRQRQR